MSGSWWRSFSHIILEEAVNDVGSLRWALVIPFAVLLCRPAMEAWGKWLPQSLPGRKPEVPKLTPLEKLQQYHQLAKVV